MGGSLRSFLFPPPSQRPSADKSPGAPKDRWPSSQSQQVTCLLEEARHTYFLQSIVICTVAFHFYLFLWTSTETIELLFLFVAVVAVF